MPENKESKPEPPAAPGALAPPPPPNPFGTPSVSPVPTRRTQVTAALKLVAALVWILVCGAADLPR